MARAVVYGFIELDKLETLCYSQQNVTGYNQMKFPWTIFENHTLFTQVPKATSVADAQCFGSRFFFNKNVGIIK